MGGAEKIKKCNEKISVLVPPKRSGGGRKRTSLFWILFKESSNIVQKTPQIIILKLRFACTFKFLIFR
jgi:hypothetical protein